MQKKNCIFKETARDVKDFLCEISFYDQSIFFFTLKQIVPVTTNDRTDPILLKLNLIYLNES